MFIDLNYSIDYRVLRSKCKNNETKFQHFVYQFLTSLLELTVDRGLWAIT